MYLKESQYPMLVIDKVIVEGSCTFFKQPTVTTYMKPKHRIIGRNFTFYICFFRFYF
jgi:hypothetical protein